MSNLRYLSAVVCVAIVACTPTEQGTWREEVALGEGRTITVQRTALWEEVQQWGQATQYATRSIELRLPRQSGQSPPPWRGKGEFLVLLDFDDARKEFVLVTLVGSCSEYIKAGRPRPPHIEYRLRAGEWVAVPLEQEWIGRDANMIVYPRVSREPGLVTVRDKGERQARMTGIGSRVAAEGGLPGC